MRKYAKKIVALVLAVMLVAACFTGCAKINYVTNGTIGAIKEVQNGTWNQKEEADPNASADGPVIDQLTPGTYGGIEFKTNEDVANYYVKCFDNTKSQLADYKNSNGEIEQCYKLLGTEELTVGSLLIEGKENGMLNNAVGPIVGNLFQSWAKGLPPTWGNKPSNDHDDEGNDFTKSLFTADDIEACNVSEDENGNIVMEIQPKSAEMAMHNGDSQGKFFAVLGDIGGVVASIDIVSFAQGDANDNVKVSYSGGTGKVTIDPKTNEVIAGEYVMNVHVSITHANALGVIKDKSAALDIVYKNSYPASDEYLLEKGLTRA